jgi:hypothetical protein
MKLVKIIVFVPTSHADLIRKTMGDAGAGKMGEYSHCSFTLKGIGRFLPEKGANPTIGRVGEFEEVDEERIEMICPRNIAKKVISEIKKVHPYEEVALDIQPLLPEEDL